MQRCRVTFGPELLPLNRLPFCIHMKAIISLAALTCLAAPSFAQVAPGNSVVFTVGGSPKNAPQIMDAFGTNALQNMTGIPSAYLDVNDGVLDPVTGDLWCITDDYDVFRIQFTGGLAGNVVPVINLGSPGNGLVNIDLDGNGNAIVCDEKRVWSIDRYSSAATLWADENVPGELAALTVDDKTNTLWVATRALTPGFGARILEYNLNAAPALGTTIFNVSASGFPDNTTSIVHDGQGTLHIGALDGLYKLNAATGAASLATVSMKMNSFFPATNQINSLDYDSFTNHLHTGGGGFENGIYHVVDLAVNIASDLNYEHECILFFSPDLCTSAATVTGVTVNDFQNETQLFPRVASISAGFTVELAARGLPGDLALMAMTQVNGFPVGPYFIGGFAGVVGAGGNWNQSVPVAPGILPAGLLSLGFNTATYDAGFALWIPGGTQLLALKP